MNLETSATLQLDAFTPGQAGDLFGFAGETLETGVKKFASGVLAPAIWEGYRRAGNPMCIAASETNAGALERACAFVRDGGELLVDSGAFVYRDDPEGMPWERVIEIYGAIANAATGKVTFILPDEVGSQQRTLAALRTWGNKVLAAIGPRHEALLPVQRGSKTPASFIKEALLCLDAPVGGLALPSNAAAFPAEDVKLLSDVPAIVPHRLHFLGISRNSHALQDRLFRLKEIWPDAEVSCDACEHRALVGRNKPITMARADALNTMWESELDEWDDTEDEAMDEQALAALRAQHPGFDDEQLEALMCSQVGSWSQLQAKHQSHAKVKGPSATTESIYAYATGALGTRNDVH